MYILAHVYVCINIYVYVSEHAVIDLVAAI